MALGVLLTQLDPSPLSSLHLTYHRDVQAAGLGVRLGSIESSLGTRAMGPTGGKEGTTSE